MKLKIKEHQNKITLLILICVLILLTVIGSLYDYEISSLVYLGETPSDNLFGIIFAFIGIIPTFVGWSFLGSSILFFSNQKGHTKRKRYLLTALAVLLFVLSFFYFCNTLFLVNERAFPVHWAIAYSIGVITIVLVAMLGYKLTQKSNNPNLLKMVLTLTFVSLITMLIIMITKEIMDRPRFRFIEQMNNADLFINWWQNGKHLKDQLQTQIVSDEFSSFPSGHSAYSMFAIFIFPLLSEYCPKLKKHPFFLFLLGLLWWVLTAFSRITVGAHYLTDVSIAGLITIVVYATTCEVKHLLKNRK